MHQTESGGAILCFIQYTGHQLTFSDDHLKVQSNEYTVFNEIRVNCYS